MMSKRPRERCFWSPVWLIRSTIAPGTVFCLIADEGWLVDRRAEQGQRQVDLHARPSYPVTRDTPRLAISSR